MTWRIDPSIIVEVVGLAAAVLGGALWLWWWVPKWQMRSITAADPKARADIEDNFRKTIGQLVGGFAVLIGAGFAYLQFTQQQQAAQQQFSQQQQGAHELLISNQVAKGFEQLGSDKVVVRVGGIYALEGVMKASERYHVQVLDALCAYVRDGTRTEMGDRAPAADIQAALTVIGRRVVLLLVSGPNLAEAHIPKADLTAANLSRANLRSAVLNGAKLIGTNLTRADLSGASLSYADPSYADLRGAKVMQAQLDQACGTDVKLDAGLTIKPCP